MSSTTDSQPEAVTLGHWSIALFSDAPAARQAMNEIAASYWYPVYAWWRRAGLPAEKAAIATEACFTRWRDKEPPAATDEGSPRLRQWLLARLRVLASAGVKPLPDPALRLSRSWAEEQFAKEPERDPDAVFERRWALTMLEFTVSTLLREYAASGKAELFTQLLPFLGFSDGEERYEEVAPMTGMSAAALHVAVFDFRKRYRELLRKVVADTVARADEVDGELAALLCAAS